MNRSKFFKSIGILGAAVVVAPKLIIGPIEPEVMFLSSGDDLEIHRNGADGVLMIPEDAIPNDMDINEIAEQWSKYNGVIRIKPTPHSPPPKFIKIPRI